MGHLEILDALLAAGADANTRDADGLAAREYAKHQNIIDRLSAV
jgi:ankyrin repeat protein